MSLISRVSGFYRLYKGTGRFLRERVSPQACVEAVRASMARREDNFITFLGRTVFANPDSPYLALLGHAGIDRADLEQLVRREGLDDALAHLRDEGVYVSAEEFKGFKPAVRGSRTFHFEPEDFDNRLLRSVYASRTGGSLWRPTRVLVDLEHIAQTAVHYGLWFAANDWMESPLVYWTPAHVGIANSHLRCARFGKYYTRWFALATNTGFTERIISGTVHRIVSRRAGLSGPETTPVGEVAKVVDYVAELAAKGLGVCVRTTPSSAVRIALAARERGRPLTGVSFLLGGEALTAHRRDTIHSAGALAYQTYGCAEAGPIACQSGQPEQVDDVHLLEDAFAVVPRRRVLDDGDEVTALLVTGIRPAAPKVLINTELGDYGTISRRRSDCLFGQVGYTTHLHSVRSFQKLTGEGMTVVGDDLTRLVEQRLPARFGGSLTDYQVLEESDGDGLTRYALLASPDLPDIDDGALKGYFLGELERMRSEYALMVQVWSRSGNFEVRRQYPLLTSRGKLKPFRVMRPE